MVQRDSCLNHDRCPPTGSPNVCTSGLSIPSCHLKSSFTHSSSRFYLPFLAFSWGVVCTCIGAVKFYIDLIGVRVFPGLCEAGLIGGIIIYLAIFYRRNQLVYRIGLFYAAAPASGAIGGLLAAGLSKTGFRGYNRWPWIFSVEGAVTVVFSLLAMTFLPNTPGEARFLTPDGRIVAVERMFVDAQGATDAMDVGEEAFSWHWVKMAATSWNTILLSLNIFWYVSVAETQPGLFLV